MNSLFDGDSSSGVSMWRSEWGNIKTLQNQLDDQIASSASNQRRLSSQLSRLQGDLGQRVDRLSRAFDAFVELSELRDQLTMHSDARRWRAAAKSMIETAVATGVSPTEEQLPDLADVSDYWLVPALRCLPGIVDGHPDADLLGEAARRDDVRSTLFVAASSVMIANNDVVGAWVARAVSGAPNAAVTIGQRALWLAAADGEMTTTAMESVRAELRRRLDAISLEQRTALVHGLVAFPPGAAPSATARSTETATAATEMLRRWASWCTQLSASGEIARAARPAPASATIGVGSPSGPAGPSAPRGSDAVLEVVRSLVEEGSGPEREMLDRAESLMSVVRGASPAGTAAWDADAGAVADLLAGDLRQNSEPGRARFALELLHVHLSDAADELGRQAHAATPAAVAISVGGRTIAIGPNGAAADEVAAVEAALTRPTPPRIPRWTLPVVAVGTVLFAVLGIVSAPAWLVLAGIGAIGAGAMVVIDRRDKAERADSARIQQERLHKRVAESVAELTAATSAVATAATDSDELRRQIGDAIAAARRR